ncbi:hypothetical protein BVX97_01340 [bacterium E08(2017)]|nr:hypothetical protein BVX97_01340 [bacterium E08(2017)]
MFLTRAILFEKNTVFAFNDGNIEGAITQFKYPESFLHSWTNQTFFGRSFGTQVLSLTGLSEAILGPFGHRRVGVLLAALLTAMVGYWCTRQFGRSRYASLAAATLFLLCGWNLTFPTAGLPIRSYALASCLLSLGLLEKARRTDNWLIYPAAGGLLGLALSESLDVGAIFAIACGGFFVLSHLPLKKDSMNLSGIAIRGARLALYIAATALIAYQALVVVGGSVLGASSGAGDTKSPQERYEWATQWSLPKAETWSLIACDHHGASSRSAASPYWGGMGRTAGWEQHKQGFRNFRLAGYSLGAVSFVFMAFLISYLATNRSNSIFKPEDKQVIYAALIIAAVCLMLSWGKHFPLYKLFYSLPKMSSIRNPDKWLGPFTAFFGILFAHGFDAVLYSAKQSAPADAKKTSRVFLAVSGLIPLVAIIILAYLGAASGLFLENLKSFGFGELAGTSLSYARISNLLALITSIACIATIFIITTKKKFDTTLIKTGVTAGVCILMAIELGRAGLPFMIGQSYKHLNNPNPLTDYLDSNRNNGRIKLMPSNNPLINNWRMTYLMAKSYNLFDPVSIREMPADMKKLLDTFSANPLRLWQIGSIRYFICTPDMASNLLNLKSGEQELFAKRLELSAWQTPGGALIPIQATSAQRKYIEVLEFHGALPPFRFTQNWITVPDTEQDDTTVLQQLNTPQFNPITHAYIHHDKVPSGAGASGKVGIVSTELWEARLKTSADGDGLLLRAERYHPDWKVTIDGKPAELLRSNYHFQAVKVPAGDHDVVFRFSPSLFPLTISVTGRLGLIVLLVLGTFIIRPSKPTVSSET